MSEQAALDPARRYLVPVARLDLPGQPDEVHLSVYEWLPQFEEWATGPALCGYSTSQGALPEGTEVTCAGCREYRPRYERMLAPGCRPESDDPDVLRAELTVARAEIVELKRERDVLRRSLARLADVVASVAALAFGREDSRRAVLRTKWLTADRVLAYTSDSEEGCDCDRTAFRRSWHVGHLVTCPLNQYRRPRHYGKQAGQ